MSHRPKGRAPKNYGYTAPEPESESKSFAVWIVLSLLAVAVIAAIVIAAVNDSGGDDEEAFGATTQSVRVSGESLPPMSGSGSSDPAIGMTIPSVAGFEADNSPVSIKPGSPMLVAGVAHWCPHCQAEVPLLVDWREAGIIPDSVEVIGVSTGVDETRGNYPPASWLAQEGWSDPVLVDNEAGDAFAALGGQSFPYLLAVDASGTVVGRTSGEAPVEEVQALVAKALGT